MSKEKPPMPPLKAVEDRLAEQFGERPTAWDKWRAIHGWQREIHRLKAFPIGGLPFTDRAREAMGIHASEIRRAYEALEAWMDVEED